MHADIEYSSSVKITQPLTYAILEGNSSHSYEIIADHADYCKNLSYLYERKMSFDDAEDLKSTLPSTLRRAMELTQERGPQTG